MSEERRFVGSLRKRGFPAAAVSVPQPPPRGAGRVMIKRLLHYLSPHRLKMAAVMVTVLSSAAIQMLNPWPLKIVVDNVLLQQPLFGHVPDDSWRGGLLALVAFAYVVLAAAGGTLGLLRERWLTEVSQRASLAMSSDLYSQVQRLSLRFHDRARVGDTVTRITSDVERLQDAFISGVSSYASDVFTLLAIGVTMFVVDWQFALVALLVLPPLFLIFSVFRPRIKEASLAVRSSEGAMVSLAQEVLSSIRLVKAFGQEDREQERYRDQTHVKLEASIRVATWGAMLSLWIEVATAAGIGIVLGYGGWRVMRGHLTVGELLVFVQYVNTLYSPVRSLSRLTIVVQKASASADRINELYQAAPEVPERPHALSLERARGRIVFEGVWFGYSPERWVLRGIDLEIAAGEAVAVVGPTGAGKSTLVSLIPRFYDPSEGRLLIDGEDARDLNLRSLRDQVSIVLQDPILFSGSIRDNIAYGRPDATERQVLAAARAAFAHDFILELPEGYGSQVGERGVTLSGGQRQRVGIARALLKDAPILILDEPTSSVDLASEGVIIEALRRLVRGRTVIIISHRHSTAELAERVTVLRDGRIVETGVTEPLHARGSAGASSPKPWSHASRALEDGSPEERVGREGFE